MPPGSIITGERSNLNVQDYKSNFTKPQFCDSVNKAKEYIKAGDIFQVVISQRLSTEYSGDPFPLYRSVRQINPSP